MKCGIIGLPNVGKSTLFNCLSKYKSVAANFPFSTISPNQSIIKVPDNRLLKINNIIKSKRIIYSNINIVDIAGLVKGAHKGEGLGNKFLDNIRKTDVIIHILRCFKNKDIIHVEKSINPIRDKEIIDTELQLKDLEIIKKQIDKLYNIFQKNKLNKTQKILLNTLLNVEKYVIKGKNIRNMHLKKEEKKIIQHLQLLTIKPVIHLCNIDEYTYKNKNNEYIKDFHKHLKKYKKENIMYTISAQIESEIAEINNKEEKKFFLKENLGRENSIADSLIKKIYSLLNLHSFFTVSEKEIKSWCIKKNTKAPEAASKIHQDFKTGFICVEVIKYQDFIEHKSIKKIKEIGKLFIQGKNYIIEDGDILKFRFNVSKKNKFLL